MSAGKFNAGLLADDAARAVGTEDVLGADGFFRAIGMTEGDGDAVCILLEMSRFSLPFYGDTEFVEMFLQDVFGDVLAENQGVWVRTVDSFHVAMAEVFSIADDFDAAHGVGDSGEFVRETHGVEDFLGADMEDECFGDVLRAGGFIDNAAGDAVACHFRGKC